MRRHTPSAMCAARWRVWNAFWRKNPRPMLSKTLPKRLPNVLLEMLQDPGARIEDGLRCAQYGWGPRCWRAGEEARSGHRRRHSVRTGPLRRRVLERAARGAHGNCADPVAERRRAALSAWGGGPGFSPRGP